jgi:hypothetical protein
MFFEDWRTTTKLKNYERLAKGPLWRRHIRTVDPVLSFSAALSSTSAMAWAWASFPSISHWNVQTFSNSQFPCLPAPFKLFYMPWGVSMLKNFTGLSLLPTPGKTRTPHLCSGVRLCLQWVLLSIPHTTAALRLGAVVALTCTSLKWQWAMPAWMPQLSFLWVLSPRQDTWVLALSQWAWERVLSFNTVTYSSHLSRSLSFTEAIRPSLWAFLQLGHPPSSSSSLCTSKTGNGCAPTFAVAPNITSLLWNMTSSTTSQAGTPGATFACLHSGLSDSTSTFLQTHLTSWAQVAHVFWSTSFCEVLLRFSQSQRLCYILSFPLTHP